MTTNQETQTLEETLDKTDLGHVINENKKPILIAGAIIVIAIIAYSIMNQIAAKGKYEKLDRVFSVEQSVFNTFMEDKTKATAFKIALSKINNELVADPNLIPVFMSAINKLDQAGEVDLNTIAIADKWMQKLNKSNALFLFFAMRIAALKEDAKQTKEAIAILESLVGHKTNLLKDKIHFDLGRMYLASGDKTTANERFKFLFDNHKDSQFAKLAKLYLNGL